MKKQLLRWAKLLVLLYCIVGIAWYYGQNKLIFHPVPVRRQATWSFGRPFKELNIPYDTATNINVIQFTATDRPKDSTAKGVVLFFHGSSGNIEDYSPVADGITPKGYEIWMIDYPGYGKSSGPVSEKILYRNALLFYKLARSRWQPGQIILYGKGLGTGIAAQLASVRDCRRLILESPYFSLTSLFRRYLFMYPVSQMLHFHLPTNEYLPDVSAPVTIFHGDDDRTIPYGNSARLKPLLKRKDEFITIPGGGHNDLHSFPFFRQKLDSLLSL
ncbi:MAG: alpha/beta hydrolase [Bacteroidetes bacterium]|nr:alpha/beta hydrolase [Bacteroidota bacterium]